MKQKEIVVVRNGLFLRSYKNNPGTLAYDAEYCDDITKALTIPTKFYDDEDYPDRESMKKLAELVEGQLTVVEIEYKVHDLEGNEIDMEQAREVHKEAEQQTFENKPKGRYDWLERGIGNYYIRSNGMVDYDSWNDFEPVDEGYLSIGNVFQTKEEALFEVERLKVIHELKEFSRPHKDEEMNFFLVYGKDTQEVEVFRWDSITIFDVIYFKSSEEAKKAIEKIGAERIKKYYFRVED